MCTLIALHRWYAAAPLVVAANRDEFLERPSRGPALRPTPRGRVLSPLDSRAGGTWLGLNSDGVFAALTNRPCASPDPRFRSRGLLVSDALDAESAAEAVEKIEKVIQQPHNPFNFFVADGERAFAISYDGSGRRFELGAGVHVIGNADLAAPDTPKLGVLRAQVEAAAGAPLEGALDALAEVCRSHDGGDPLRDACVHAGAYGTRSSTLLCLADDPDRNAYRYADGPPCRTPYEDFTPLLRDLRVDSRYVEGESPARRMS